MYTLHTIYYIVVLLKINQKKQSIRLALGEQIPLKAHPVNTLKSRYDFRSLLLSIK